MRRALTRVLVAVALGAAAWGIGLDPLHAVALAGGACAVLLLATAAADRDEAEWDRARERGPGGRADVEEIAWSLVGRDGAVRPRLLARLRAAIPAPTGALAGVLQPDRRITPPELDRALAEHEHEEER